MHAYGEVLARAGSVSLQKKGITDKMGLEDSGRVSARLFFGTGCQ